MRLDIQGHASIYSSENAFKDVTHRFSDVNVSTSNGRGKKLSITLTSGANAAVHFDGIDSFAAIGIVAEYPVAVDFAEDASPGSNPDYYIQGRELFFVNSSSNLSISGLYIHNLEPSVSNTIRILLAGEVS